MSDEKWEEDDHGRLIRHEKRLGQTWAIMADAAYVNDLESRLATAEQQAQKAEAEWRETEKEVQFYAGRNGELIAQAQTYRTALEKIERWPLTDARRSFVRNTLTPALHVADALAMLQEAP